MIVSTVGIILFWEALNFYGTLGKLHEIMFLKIKTVYKESNGLWIIIERNGQHFDTKLHIFL